MTVSAVSTAERLPATLRDYVALARPDHWVKHVFIVPGVALAWLLRGGAPPGLAAALLLGFASAIGVASANYVINEWLDAARDAFHPSKASRPAVAKRLSRGVVVAEYLLLAVAGLLLGAAVSPLFLATAALFLVSGLVYNVPPLRTKERPYVDVLTESLNNPIRLTLGWAMVDSTTLPPSSLLIAYWMGGAFLMGLKRLAELRSASAGGTLAALGDYRPTFRVYTENRLLLTTFLYAQMAAFFLGVFLIKYRVEYLLSLPFFAALFTAYLRVGLKRESRAQAPEELFREKALMIMVALLVVVLAVLTWVEVPLLDRLSDPHYIRLGRG